MFDGTIGAKEPEQWIHHIDYFFETINCNDTECRRLSVFQLTYSATDWQETVKATIGEEVARAMAQPVFKARFLKKYFPDSEKDKREQEFLELVQGKMMVQEYTLQFERLSRFAPHLVDTPQKKMKKYH